MSEHPLDDVARTYCVEGVTGAELARALNSVDPLRAEVGAILAEWRSPEPLPPDGDRLIEAFRRWANTLARLDAALGRGWGA